MAFTIAQLNALDSAIASGQLRFSYNGKSVEYRSIDDLKKARQLVHDELVASGAISAVALSNRGPASVAIFSRD